MKSVREDVARRRIGELARLHRLDVELLEAVHQHETPHDAEMNNKGQQHHSLGPDSGDRSRTVTTDRPRRTCSACSIHDN